MTDEKQCRDAFEAYVGTGRWLDRNGDNYAMKSIQKDWRVWQIAWNATDQSTIRIPVADAEKIEGCLMVLDNLLQEHNQNGSAHDKIFAINEACITRGDLWLARDALTLLQTARGK